MTLARLFPVALLLVLAATPIACGSGDADDATPTRPLASLTAPQSATPSPAASASPGVSPAESLAKSPRYFVYFAGKGDTLASIADAFGGAPGKAPAAFADSIKTLNQLTGAAINEGQPLAIPLVLPGDLSLIPDASMEAALGIGVAAGKLQLLQPSLAMRDGYKNRIMLHRVRLADGKPADEGYGYVTEYFLADRPPFKGGGLDEDAKAGEPLFTVAGGSLIATLTSSAQGDLFPFTRDGVSYIIKVFPGAHAQQSPSELAAMLQTARKR